MSEQEHKRPSGLPIDAVAQATRVCSPLCARMPCSHTSSLEQQAQRDGVFAGLSSGLVSGTCLPGIRFIVLAGCTLRIPDR